MTFEYKGAHPRIPRTKVRGRRGSKPSDPEEKLEDTPVVAELRVAVAKENVPIHPKIRRRSKGGSNL